VSGEEDSCRIDVWLWRARFCKTRSLAARVVETEGVRLTRGATRVTLEKPSRQVRVGDGLAFAMGSRWIALRVEALGERRGPAAEAQGLYVLVDVARANEPTGLDTIGRRGG
jgi:ribosome-associated heat shock protein Hsp15